MIQAAYAQSGKRPSNVGANIQRVEVAPVGKKALENLRAKAKPEGYDEERKVERSPAGGVQDPIECDLGTKIKRENKYRDPTTLTVRRKKVKK